MNIDTGKDILMQRKLLLLVIHVIKYTDTVEKIFCGYYAGLPWFGKTLIEIGYYFVVINLIRCQYILITSSQSYIYTAV